MYMSAVCMRRENNIKTKDMNYDLIELAKSCPDLTISVRLSDLIEANRELIEETKRELAESLAESKKETYLTREKVMEMLEALHRPSGVGRNAAISSLYPSAQRNGTASPTSLKSSNDENEKYQSIRLHHILESEL